jgi:transcriptional regulator GlxA family with amidase domain
MSIRKIRGRGATVRGRVDDAAPDTATRKNLLRRDKALVAASRLLESAQEALSRDDTEAREYIEKAMAVIRAERESKNAEARAKTARLDHGCLAPSQLSRVIDFVDANLGRTVRTRDLAASARLSASYFSQTFRASVGQSPHAFVMRRRVERAQELMLGTNKPLSEIALDCGLADQPHLTRLFRRIVGTSPAAWRRHWSATGEPS